MDNNPRVFISYAHKNQAYEDKVLKLANRLRSEGIDAVSYTHLDYKPSVDNLINALAKNIESHSKSFLAYKEHISEMAENIDVYKRQP